MNQTEKGSLTISSADRLRSGETRRKIRDATASADQLAERRYSDIAKALVMGQVVQFVGVGLAQWNELNNGDIEVRFVSGELFHLGRRRSSASANPARGAIRSNRYVTAQFNFASSDSIARTGVS